LGFKNWHCFLPENGTDVPKHVGDAYLTFLLNNTAFSWHNAETKMYRMDNFKICNVLLTTDSTLTPYVRNLTF